MQSHGTMDNPDDDSATAAKGRIGSVYLDARTSSVFCV